MKSIVLKYGLFGGLLVAAVMLTGTVYCVNTGKFEGSMVLGYASMLLAFSFIFVAVKQVRDREPGAAISFGRAFKVALLVTLVTSTIYVIAWLICYYFFIPDFMDRYTAHMMTRAQSEGLNSVQLADKAAEMKRYVEMYKNPLLVILFTYLEILPVGLLVSLVAALVLKKKQQPEPLPV
ncbi:MAG: DUF4199 domain-containing protein [Chitinophagaceae bacterium]|nr:MAG: DUF4199 domain-containing protein [Chitinophagaceae bacterium]